MSLKDKILSVIAILPWIYFLLVYPIALQILKLDWVRTKQSGIYIMSSGIMVSGIAEILKYPKILMSSVTQ